MKEFATANLNADNQSMQHRLTSNCFSVNRDKIKGNGILNFNILSLSFHAADNTDYESERLTVTFPAGINVISFNVTIIDDNIAELAELFTLDLEIPATSAAMGVIKGSPDIATVNIMDDEG